MGNAVSILGAIGGGLMTLTGMGWLMIVLVFRDIAHSGQEECSACEEILTPSANRNDKCEKPYLTMYDIVGRKRNIFYAAGLLAMGLCVFIGALKW